MLDLMKFYASVQFNAQWGSFKSFNQSEYTRRSAGILTAQQLMLAPANTHDIPTVDADIAQDAYQRMLNKPEFIEWVSIVMFYRTDDLREDNQWLQEARELRDRVLAQPGVNPSASAAKEPVP